MGGKPNKIAIVGADRHPFEYVSAPVLSYMIGRAPASIPRDKESEFFHQIGFTYVGAVRKYSFYDAAKLVYPYLTNYEIAKLRVEINSIMLEERRKHRADKSRSKE